MKKILILLFISVFSFSFSQGYLYIENYSGYDLLMRAIAGNPNNCHPEAVGSLKFPAYTQDVIDNFNDAIPYTDMFSVRLAPTGSATSQYIPSGLLNTISPLTQWKFIWFHTVDSTGNTTNDIDFNMGDPSFFASCPLGGVTYEDGALTDAFWF